MQKPHTVAKRSGLLLRPPQTIEKRRDQVVELQVHGLDQFPRRPEDGTVRHTWLPSGQVSVSILKGVWRRCGRGCYEATHCWSVAIAVPPCIHGTRHMMCVGRDLQLMRLGVGAIPHVGLYETSGAAQNFRNRFGKPTMSATVIGCQMFNFSWVWCRCFGPTAGEARSCV